MLKKNLRDIDIGKIIKQKVDESNMTKQVFAQMIGCNRTTLYAIFKSKSIDTEVLVKISRVLKYNFLLEYFEEKKIFGKHILFIETDNTNMEKIINDLSSNKLIATIKAWIDECV